MFFQRSSVVPHSAYVNLYSMRKSFPQSSIVYNTLGGPGGVATTAPCKKNNIAHTWLYILYYFQYFPGVVAAATCKKIQHRAHVFAHSVLFAGVSEFRRHICAHVVVQSVLFTTLPRCRRHRSLYKIQHRAHLIIHIVLFAILPGCRRSCSL